MQLIVGGPDAPAANPALVRPVREGLRYRDVLLASPDQEVAALAAEVGITGSHFTRLMRLGFLAPDIIAAILAGRQPTGLNATALLRDTRLPLDWPAQRRMLGFPDLSISD